MKLMATLALEVKFWKNVIVVIHGYFINNHLDLIGLFLVTNNE